MAKHTESPYSEASFTLTMVERLGYTKCVDEPCDLVVHWEKTRNVKDLGRTLNRVLPKHVTFLRPDHEAEGYSGDVYDQNVVLDFLEGILGLTRHAARAQITAVMTITGQANRINFASDGRDSPRNP